jgi:hypothetical protein
MYFAMFRSFDIPVLLLAPGLSGDIPSFGVLLNTSGTCLGTCLH